MLLMIFLLICFLFAFSCKFLSCAYVPQPRKFTAFIDESVEKINPFPANSEVSKS